LILVFSDVSDVPDIARWCVSALKPMIYRCP